MRLSPRLFPFFAAQIILWFCCTLSAETIVFTHGGPQSVIVGYRVYINGVNQGDRLMNTIGQVDTYVFGNTTATLEVKLFRSASTTISPPVTIATMQGSGGTVTHSVTVYSDGTYGGPPVTWTLNTRTTNQTAFPQYYDVYVNGAKVGGSGLVPPGSYYEFEYSGPAKASVQLVRYRYDGEGKATDITYSRTIGTDDPAWFAGDGVPPTSNSGVDNKTDVPKPPELNNLGFTDTSDLAKEATLRRVGEVLYDSQQQGFAGVQSELRGVKGAINSGADSVRNAVMGLQSLLSSMDNKLSAGNGHLANIESGIAGVNSNLDQVEGGLNSVNSTIQQGNGKLDTVIQRLEAANIHHADIKSAIGVGNVTLASIEGKMVNVDLRLGEGNQHLATIKDNTQRTKEAIENQTANDNQKAGQIVNAITQVKEAIQNQTANDNTNHGQAQNSRQQIKEAIDAFKQANHNDLADIKNAIDANTQSTSNLLQKIHKTMTNVPPEPDYPSQLAAGQAAGAQGQAAAQDLADSIQGPGSGGIGPVAENPWVIQWTFLGKTYTVDCDLTHYSAVVALAAKVKVVLALMLTGYYIFAIWKHAELWLATGSMVPQAKAAGTTIFGTNANTPIALAMAGLITVALFSLMAAATLAIHNAGASNLVSGIAGEMRTGPTVWLLAMQLFDMFVPWATALSLLAQYMIFRSSFTGVFWGVATVIRFLVG